MMMVTLGAVLLALSVALIKLAKRHALAGEPLWSAAANSTWLPILFTAMFGLGFVVALSGVFDLFGA